MAEIGALFQALGTATAWPVAGWSEVFIDGDVVFTGGRIEMQLPLEFNTENTIIPSPSTGDGYGGPVSWSTRVVLQPVLEPVASDYYVDWGAKDGPGFYISTPAPKLIVWRGDAAGFVHGATDYDPTVHVFLSMRLSGTDVYYEYSVDGTTWIQLVDTEGPGAGIGPGIYPLSAWPLFDPAAGYWGIFQNRNSGHAEEYILAFPGAVVVVPPDPTDGSVLEPVALTVSSLGSCPPVAEGVSGILTLSVLEECPSPSRSEALYVTQGGFAAVDTSLFILDPADMSLTAVGDTGHFFTGLAQDPTTGILYGYTGNVGDDQRSLFTIDPLTGAATLVGGGVTIFADICFDSAGILYGWSPQAAATGVRNRLSIIDKATVGITTFAVTSGTGASFGCGISCDENDLLWIFPFGVDEGLFTVDRTTGLATQVGNLHNELPASNSTVSAASFNSTGTLYGICVANPALLFTVGTPDEFDLYPLMLTGTFESRQWDGMAWITV